MQRIDVLRDDCGAWNFTFKTRERDVRRVRFHLGVGAAAHVVEIVDERRVFFKTFRRCNFAPIIFGPDAGRIAERREPAFG